VTVFTVRVGEYNFNVIIIIIIIMHSVPKNGASEGEFHPPRFYRDFRIHTCYFRVPTNVGGFYQRPAPSQDE